MRMEDMIIVSVDDHIVEPPDLFDEVCPAKFRDRAPKLVRNERGEDVWVFEGMPTVNFALNAVAGRRREELGFEPSNFDHIRKGCYDVHARVDDMNVNGILASLNFPTFVGTSLELFNNCKDRELGLAMIQAYNDWHLDHWCAAYPARYIPMTSLPLFDMNAAVAELRRTAAKGVRTISFPSLPQLMGLPSIHDAYWKPLWGALCDLGLPISIHITAAARTGSEHLGMDSPIDAFLTKINMCAYAVATEWLWSRIPRDYKDIKVVLSEGGIGWIPYMMERADLVQRNHGPWTRQDWGGRQPSEVFRDHFISCFIEDRAGVEMRESIGIDNITYEQDYPHADITWPNTPEQLHQRDLAGLPDEHIDKITHANALRVYRFDPFAIMPRDQCTVGALRARATHVDLTPIEGGGRPPSEGVSRVVTAADVAKQFAAFKLD
ncbi:MAG: amidohydrolase family protein [Gammaproteobacteria bacterium]